MFSERPDIISAGRRVFRTFGQTVRAGIRSVKQIRNWLEDSSKTDGLIVGSVTFITGYMLVYAFSIVHLKGLQINQGLDGVGVTFRNYPPIWKLSGWLLYGSHSVSIDFPAPGGIVSRNLVNVLTHGLAQVPYFVLPPVLLLSAGTCMVYRNCLSSPQEAMLRGTSIVFGYLPLSAVGAYMTYVPAQVGKTRVTVGPNMWMGTVYAGGIYPIVFGGFGGLIAYTFLTQSQSTHQTAGEPARYPGPSVSHNKTSRSTSSNVVATTRTNEQTLPDPEYIMDIIDDSGGQLKQKELVQETGWSEAKVSRITSALEEKGAIEKLQIGRENIVSEVNDTE